MKVKKLKERHKETVRQLTDDIIILVEDKDPMAVALVKTKWAYKMAFENAVWNGKTIINH